MNPSRTVAHQTNPVAAIRTNPNAALAAGSGRAARHWVGPTMAERSGQPRGPRTGAYPGTFDPIHNSHLDIIRRATLFHVVEDGHGAVARLVGAAEPNEPEPDGRGPNEPEPNSFGSNEPGGGDPNAPELDGRGPNEPGGDRNRPEPDRFGPNEPGPNSFGSNEPESDDGSGLDPLGPASESPDHG
jgi:hypothetical protein